MSDYWMDQTHSDYACAQEYVEIEERWGVHPLKHFHWKVICTYDGGFKHESIWHAGYADAQRIVHEESRIRHEQETGYRGCARTIECIPLDRDGNPLKEKG